jgi:EAL domain-containing protein (putative c-di-GMP-specific phosphodiesterase class I)
MPRTGRGHILLWATLLSAAIGFLQLTTPLENNFRDLRNSTHVHAASGDIALVEIDNATIDELKVYPWPRRYFADLINKVHGLGARRIFVDVMFDYKSNPQDDQALADVVSRLGPSVVLPVLVAPSTVPGKFDEILPLPELRKSASLAHSTFMYDAQGMVRRAPYGWSIGGRNYPSFASTLANVSKSGTDFPIDYSIDPASIPRVRALDIFKGHTRAHELAGKDVVISPTHRPLSAVYSAPGDVLMPAAYVHLLGAETLKAGIPIEIPWFVAFGAAFILVAFCTLANRRAATIGVMGFAGLLCVIVPLILDRQAIFAQMVPSLLLVTFTGIGFSLLSIRRTYRARGTTNAVSGMPNLVALAESKDTSRRPLVAVRVHNFAAIVATLQPGKEKLLVHQIARRLAVGAPECSLYQGDEGIFAWFSEIEDVGLTGVHLDALHSMFRSPIMVEDQQFDLSITFGFDTEFERSIPNRVASALVAAENAHKEGLKWKAHDPSQLEDSAWKLSLLSQLDAAIDGGDLWVAYQPKADMTTGAIVGAEALARWTHPEKGPISPIEFILAAEKSNRIEKLTHFVLENAIRVAAAVNRQKHEFNISVNLSARLIDDPTLVATIRKLLNKHHLPPRHLTLEVTETAALGNEARSLAVLRQLRDMGLHLSVDDYGTGMSTLDYLQRIPATEIKIDRTFVIGMQSSQATRVMVNSTIQLAHSLGQKVVAEGVEDEETLEELRRMNCDFAQGFLIGKPMTFRSLSKKILGEEKGVA